MGTGNNHALVVPEPKINQGQIKGNQKKRKALLKKLLVSSQKKLTQQKMKMNSM